MNAVTRWASVIICVPTVVTAVLPCHDDALCGAAVADNPGLPKAQLTELVRQADQRKIAKLRQRFKDVARTWGETQKKIEEEFQSAEILEQELGPPVDARSEQMVRASLNEAARLILIADNLRADLFSIHRCLENLEKLERIREEIIRFEILKKEKSAKLRSLEDQLPAKRSSTLKAEVRARFQEYFSQVRAEVDDDTFSKNLSAEAGVACARAKRTPSPDEARFSDQAQRRAEDSRAKANALRKEAKGLFDQIERLSDDLLDIEAALQVLPERLRSIEALRPDWDRDLPAEQPGKQKEAPQPTRQPVTVG